MPINYKKYPKNWLSEIRPRIMKRAKNRCEQEGCSFHHGQEVFSIQTKDGAIWVRGLHLIDRNDLRFNTVVENGKVQLHLTNVKQVKVVLTIAHLDHDEENHEVEDDRLMAMCQRCHLAYDREEKKNRRINKVNLFT